MKNSKIIGLVVGVVLVLALFYVAKDYLGLGGSQNSQRDLDLATIKNNQADPDELYRSMIRLGKEQDSTAKDEALFRMRDPEARVRAAAFEALGFFADEDALSALSEGLLDADRIVRLATIRAIARRSTPARVQLILDRLKESDLLNQEKIELFATLSRIGGEKEVQSAVDWLVYLASQGTGQDNTEAAFRVASVAPDDPKVIQLYKAKLKSAVEPRMTAFALRHLASIKDAEIIKELKNYANNPNAEIRIAVVQAVSIACTDDRWEVIEAIAKNETDPRVLQALIQAPTMILGAKSIEFLQGFNIEHLTPELTELLKSTLAEVDKNKGNGNCEAN